MPAHLINEEHFFSGEWSLPSGDRASKSIAGTLRWKDMRATLELHSSFVELKSGPIDIGTHMYPAIHGATTKSDHVTLLSGHRSSNSLNIGQAGFRLSDKITSSLVIVGAHVEPDTLYSEIRMRIPGLHLWLGAKGICQTIFQKTEATPAAVEIRYEGVEEEIINVPSAAAIFGLGLDRHSSGSLTSSITIKTSACIRIRPERPQNLNWFFSQALRASTLLSLLTGASMGPNEIRAKVSGEEEHEIEILSALRHFELCDVEDGRFFFMQREFMRMQLEEVVVSWFEKYDRIAMPAQLSVSVLQSKNLWAHVEFLSLMQALEGLHRAIFESKEKIKKTLSNRLADLVSLLDDPLCRMILRQPHIPSAWIKTRNYYTHWDEALKSQIIDGAELIYANARLRVLLRVLFLRVIGMPHESIFQAFKTGNKEVQYILQLNGESK
jgi:hypothetical protein